MFQLILAVIAITLTAATVMASINYIPWWYQTATDNDVVLRSSLPVVERAYKALARSNGGVPPAPTAAPDGGFAAHFGPLLRLAPVAPRGFSWSYHQFPMDGSMWAGLNYVCLTSAQPGDLGEWMGFRKAMPVFSSDQLFLGSGCGSTASAALPSTYPASVAVTYFLTFVPGVDD